MGWDSVWEEIFKSQDWGKYPDESFIRFVARNFYAAAGVKRDKEQRAKIKLLEVGCGPGANIWFMAREGFGTFGVDGSETAITKARQRLDQEGLAADLRVGDISDLPYQDGTFDAVADNECLAHNNAKALEGILSEIHRVLKPGGMFYSRTFGDDVYKGKTYQQIGDLQYNGSSDGPFGGRGFFRLSTEATIRVAYGKFFKFISIDNITYTVNNGAVRISEWIIVCQK